MDSLCQMVFLAVVYVGGSALACLLGNLMLLARRHPCNAMGGIRTSGVLTVIDLLWARRLQYLNFLVFRCMQCHK